MSKDRNLNELARSYLAYEKIDISDFQRKARILQSIWRKERDYDAGEDRGKIRGNCIPMPWAEETLNNYLSDTIKTVVRNEVVNCPNKRKVYQSPRIFNNLLSSQPLCFNLFAELHQDLGLATKVFRQLCPDRIQKVTNIEFEHSPGRGDTAYTGDSSAFDVYVEFLNSANQKGFIGIEVKYHENLKKDDSKLRDRHFDVAEEMKCFTEEAFKKLSKPALKQIWRDHLLAGSLLHSTKPKDGFKDGFFVFLFPQDNTHCQDAIEGYKQCLAVDRTFQSWTLENLTKVIMQNTDKKWIDEVIDRYLNFEKIGL